jgi:hypothetical protein
VLSEDSSTSPIPVVIDASRHLVLEENSTTSTYYHPFKRLNWRKVGGKNFTNKNSILKEN